MGNHRVFELIHTISSAVTSPDGWSGALARLSDATRGSRVFIGTTPRTGGQFHLAAHGIDASALGLINGPLATAEANPVFSAMSRLLRESGGGIQFKPVVLSSVVPEKSLLESSLFTQVLQPCGVRHPMTVVLETSTERAISLTLGRGAAAGDFDVEDVELLTLVGPHLHCAISVQRELALARAGSMVLDSMDRGVILLTWEGRICFTNREADRILAASDGLCVAQGHLHASGAAENSRLRLLVREAAMSAQGKAVSAGGSLSVSRPSFAASYAVQVLPAGEPMPLACGVRSDPMAAVYIRDPETRSPPAAEPLKALYHLTNSEAQLAIRLYQGASLAEAAKQLGISINTAKSHLKMVFEKVGVSRQANLVRELAASLGDIRTGR